MKDAIVIVGGSGFIGTKLSEVLLEKGYVVRIVDIVPSRIQHERLTFIQSNIAEGKSPVSVIEGCVAVINLAGVTIGRRWTHSYKKQIYSSRIDTTRALVDLIAHCDQKPKTLINASAVGYYGERGNEVLHEESGPGSDFLSEVCVAWEREALRAESFGVRVAMIRTANVLGPGGLLASLEPFFRRWLGGYFGSGSQYMPWIHWKDIVGIYIYTIERNLQGAYNVGAGTTLTQKDVFKAFARSIHVPIVWPLPYLFARILFGMFADVLISSQNTLSEKIRMEGYVYRFEDISLALKDLYSSDI